MAQASFDIMLRGGQPAGALRRYLPGDELRGRLQIVPAREIDCEQLMIRLRWHTEGRGERDEQIVAEQDVFRGRLLARVPVFHEFRFTLPGSPWSYAGRYITIVWTVAVMIDIRLARNLHHSQPFLLLPAR